jgi:hypothetical protein
MSTKCQFLSSYYVTSRYYVTAKFPGLLTPVEIKVIFSGTVCHQRYSTVSAVVFELCYVQISLPPKCEIIEANITDLPKLNTLFKGYVVL